MLALHRDRQQAPHRWEHCEQSYIQCITALYPYDVSLLCIPMMYPCNVSLMAVRPYTACGSRPKVLATRILARVSPQTSVTCRDSVASKLCYPVTQLSRSSCFQDHATAILNPHFLFAAVLEGVHYQGSCQGTTLLRAVSLQGSVAGYYMKVPQE